MMISRKLYGIAAVLILLTGCSGSDSNTEPDGSTDPQIQESDQAEGEFQVRVDAGMFDRSGTVVSFHLPDDLEKGAYIMTGSGGDTVPVQVDGDNRGWFILEELAAGEFREYTFHADTDPDMDPDTPVDTGSESPAAVSYEMGERTIAFHTEDGGHVLSYYHSENEPPEALDERYRRGGYIYPVYSPSGVLLTNHLDPDLHSHHSGIWSAWTNTRFEGRTPDFWNVHNNTGRVDVDSMSAYWSGPIHGGLRSFHKFTDLSAEEPVIALNEQWEVRVFRMPEREKIHMFDLEVTQTTNTGSPLILPEYRYGGVGFRGHKDWDDPDNATFLTSGGLGRDGHATRARWAHIGGHSDGELAGVAILGHPSNYRFPQPMRIHPDEPFFNYAPTQLGGMSIEPGSPYEARYRYITYDGEPDVDLINRLWRDYAWPPVVTVRE